MNVYVFQQDDVSPIPNSTEWLSKHDIKLIYCASDDNAHEFFAKTKPDVFISVGPECKEFQTLWNLPLYMRKRWLHKATKSDIQVQHIKSCFATALEEHPRVTIFTTAFESGDRILRAYESLKAQTNQEWEWLIFDDSKTKTTWENQLQTLWKRDFRVRVFGAAFNNGYIGAVKRDIARMGRGEYLVEFDHDDELLPHALDDIIHAFESDKSVGMLGSDCIELYEGSLSDWNYGAIYGFGFHSYYKQWYEGRWVSVSRNGPLNEYTLRHIVGVVNHVRAWRRDVYDELGGHNPNLNVADDYDLIVRTFCSKYRIARLPIFLYKQYRSNSGSNFTVQRNALIQTLVHVLRDKHDDAIHDRLLDLDLKDPLWRKELHSPGTNAFMNWRHDPTADIVLDPAPDRVSIVMPTFNREEHVITAMKSVLNQTFSNWVLYVIGDKCPILDAVMHREKWTHCNRIRYWNLHNNCGQGSFPRNYALKTLVTTKYVAYLDDDNSWKPNHLQSLFDALTTTTSSQKRATFAFSSFLADGYLEVICRKPILYRIDTSCLMHETKLLAKYGYWRCDREYGYAIDWDLVKRWVGGNEPWVATELPTLLYNSWRQNMQFIYEQYGDQPKRDFDSSSPLQDKQIHYEQQQQQQKQQQEKEKGIEEDNAKTITPELIETIFHLFGGDKNTANKHQFSETLTTVFDASKMIHETKIPPNGFSPTSWVDSNQPLFTSKFNKVIQEEPSSMSFHPARKKISVTAAAEAKTQPLVITTVTYNDRFTLPLVLESVFKNTDKDFLLQTAKWYMVLQNCTDAFCEKIKNLCKKKIDLVLIRFQENIGLSKAMAYIIEQTKFFEYVLNLEDDWILLDQFTNQDWLQDCIEFMNQQKHTSTIFLRAYATDQEKWQYGWTRTIPYRNHCFQDNFNYQAKIDEADTSIMHNNKTKFSLIPKFLFTFNPCIIRNSDYHKGVYPLAIFDKDQKQKEHDAQWGYCEAMAMEKTRHFYTFWFENGIFGHHEDWFPAI